MDICPLGGKEVQTQPDGEESRHQLAANAVACRVDWWRVRGEGSLAGQQDERRPQAARPDCDGEGKGPGNECTEIRDVSGHERHHHHGVSQRLHIDAEGWRGTASTVGEVEGSGRCHGCWATALRRGRARGCGAAGPERSNPQDPDAFAVTVENAPVGYLRHETAVAYHQLVEESLDLHGLATCRALVRGGWDRGHGEVSAFGLSLLLPPPDSESGDGRGQRRCHLAARASRAIVTIRSTASCTTGRCGS